MLYSQDYTGDNALHYWFFDCSFAFKFWKIRMGDWLSLCKIDSFLGAPKLVQQYFDRAWFTILSKVSSCPWTGYCHKRSTFRKNKTVFQWKIML